MIAAVGYEALAYAAIVSAISFLAVYFLTPLAIRSLVAKGSVVQDYHKPGKPSVPRPAGPVLMIGIAAAELVLFAVTTNYAVLAILAATVIAFVVGYVDDKKVMPGWFKPVALIAAAVPIIVLGAHANSLNLVFGSAFIPLLYIPLILVIIPIAGNTVNSIDVLNGVASGFVAIATVPLLAAIAIFGSLDVFLAGLPLFFASIAFFKFHKYPSKIFPGDSGTLLLGAMYGALAIAGRAEIIGVVALLPAVVNSFLFLSSVKRIVEHRQVKARPVALLDDYKLAPSLDKAAPATLVRLILADGPLSEKEVAQKIFWLSMFSALLAFATIAIQYYFLMVVVK
ncbi:UDP-N-acetylmuramyl pentapeptide phosphotransferase/UDP-N-acetylglucosamine-1-phosphate transferase [Candidatus Nitrososphaera evergladensis SR1]|uniref:UDP-N-acetylmuramyl pentapeptide phosphotransferase/UDP-N-acetylglucosamine-1-phosphate transferase n=1 Tax=Candidatus Nitrososphaera evergladensis SR1 TaxID=1459636 RepID=A0A075MZV7_9ARCH|nr:UDP-N-acetylglucosamine-1-phosphate transferase [Candidatus Nitrososphaera evergladensis]AIF84774.1 UDP-N-acetylmuramyl pentapeptide phosphotransferase/UDP-N-acetylglucosamine-1-phosphate transferase [Candidatus Nitrososphaera evergladensis SR1]